MDPFVQVTAALASTAKLDAAAAGPLLMLERSVGDVMRDAESPPDAASSATVTRTPAASLAGESARIGRIGTLWVFMRESPWPVVRRFKQVNSCGSQDSVDAARHIWFEWMERDLVHSRYGCSGAPPVSP